MPGQLQSGPAIISQVTTDSPGPVASPPQGYGITISQAIRANKLGMLDVALR